jgi:integrase
VGRARLGTLYKKRPDAARWTGAFTHPRTGKRVIRALYADKQASRSALDRMIRDVERCVEGLDDPNAELRKKPITEHVRAYIEHGIHKQEAPRHLQVKELHLDRFIEGCDAVRIDDLTLDAASKVLRALVAEGKSARTHNHHRATLVAFMNWAQRTDRVPSHTLVRLPVLDEKCDQRRHRRALTEVDLERLLFVARHRPIADYGRRSLHRPPKDRKGRATWTRAPLTFETVAAAFELGRKILSKNPRLLERLDRLGRERELIYRTLVLTGLRKGELASLTVGALRLDHKPPYAILAPKSDKARLGAEIPLRPDLAAELRSWLEEALADERAAARREGLPIPHEAPPGPPLAPRPRRPHPRPRTRPPRR